jgi:hypothetical protein
MLVWFALGLLVGAVIGIVPFVVAARRWNTKVAANSASANSRRNAISHHDLPDDFDDFMREQEAYNFHMDCGDR